MDSLAFGLTYAISAFAAAIGAGMVGAAALNAAGRNPEKIGEIRRRASDYWFRGSNPC